MSIEELVGRLQISEGIDAEEHEATMASNAEQLHLIEAQWEARQRQHGGKE